MPKPVTIRGITYPSQAAAGRAFGLTSQAISLAKKQNRLQEIGLPNSQAKPITIEGVTFPSQAALSRILGKHNSYVCSILLYGSHGEKLKLRREVREAIAKVNATKEKSP